MPMRYLEVAIPDGDLPKAVWAQSPAPGREAEVDGRVPLGDQGPTTASRPAAGSAVSS